MFLRLCCIVSSIGKRGSLAISGQWYYNLDDYLLVFNYVGYTNVFFFGSICWILEVLFYLKSSC